MNQTRDFKSFSLHLAVYSLLLLIYFFLVLRFLVGWLEELFHQHRFEYALVAILLMAIQAAGLEVISHFILKLIRNKTKD